MKIIQLGDTVTYNPTERIDEQWPEDELTKRMTIMTTMTAMDLTVYFIM